MECLDWVIEVVPDFVDGQFDEIETRMSTFKVRICIKILNTYKVNIVNFLDLQWYSGLSLLVIKDSFLVKSQWAIQLPKMCYILSLEE